MVKTVEDVVAEAVAELRQEGTLDTSLYLQTYPDMAEELKELLPLMVSVREQREFQRAALKTKIHALSLFSELTANVQSNQVTVGGILRSELDRSGCSVAEQAKRMGLSVHSLKQLLEDSTPADQLDNSVIKKLSDQVAAPVAVLVKELRKLVSLSRSAALSASQLAFTRSGEISSHAEKQALLERVRRRANQEDGSSSRGR